MDVPATLFIRKHQTNGANYSLLAEQFAIHTIEYTARYRPYDLIIICGDDQYTNSVIDRFFKRLQKKSQKIMVHLFNQKNLFHDPSRSPSNGG